jgi:hypothetical protein
MTKHDYDCKHQEYDFYTSDCGDFCEYRKEAVKECVELGEHFRMIATSGGGDVCFNCGSKS